MWLLVIGIVLFVVIPIGLGFWLHHASAAQEEEARLVLEATRIAEGSPAHEAHEPAERWPA